MISTEASHRLWLEEQTKPITESQFRELPDFFDMFLFEETLREGVKERKINPIVETYSFYERNAFEYRYSKKPLSKVIKSSPHLIIDLKIEDDVEVRRGFETVSEEVKVLGNLANRINENLGKFHGIYSNAVSGNVSAMTDKGFRTRPLMGGEEFRFSGAYVGKSRKLIYKFTPAYATSDLTHIEVASKMLAHFFPVFSLKLEAFLGMKASDYEEVYKSDSVAKDEKIKEKKKAEKYGSNWGMFA